MKDLHNKIHVSAAMAGFIRALRTVNEQQQRRLGVASFG